MKNQGESRTIKDMNKKTVLNIIELLKKTYPEEECSLSHTDPYHLLVSVRLAAQCTDKRVNMVTPALFERFPTPYDMRNADIEEVSDLIRSTGFFRSKARDLILCAEQLCERHDGKVPDNMEELLALAGVGRKSANLILGDVFGQPAIVADTHCIRITGRLGMVTSKDPTKVEMQLRAIIPPHEGNSFCHRLVMHGRAVCDARKPRCEICTLAQSCRFFSGASS